MRIIDKDRDYYDYLQDPTDNKIVFDRRNSFLLTKERILDNIDSMRCDNKSKYRFILMQCGAAYWLFLLRVTSYKLSPVYLRHVPDNYSLTLITTWKNYDRPRREIAVELISFGFTYMFYAHDVFDRTPDEDFSEEKIKSRANDLVDAINHNNHTVERSLSELRTSICTKQTWKDIIYDVPLLKACGIANLVEPLSVFYAIEEHFSLLRSESERTEAIGITNNDKLEMHGFDVKTSFRGKNK